MPKLDRSSLRPTAVWRSVRARPPDSLDLWFGSIAGSLFTLIGLQLCIDGGLSGSAATIIGAVGGAMIAVLLAESMRQRERLERAREVRTMCWIIAHRLEDATFDFEAEAEGSDIAVVKGSLRYLTREIDASLDAYTRAFDVVAEIDAKAARMVLDLQRHLRDLKKSAQDIAQRDIVEPFAMALSSDTRDHLRPILKHCTC